MSYIEENLYKALGSLLRSARESTGLTLAEVAEKLRVTTMTVQRYEKGERKISIEKIRLLCDIYSVSADNLMALAISKSHSGVDEEAIISNNYMAFSSNLRRLRREHGMSQDDLAKKLGYKSFTTIQKWESDVSEPTVSVVKRLAEIFNVTMDELINADIPTTVGKESTNEELNPYHFALHKRVNELDESMSARVFDLLEDYLLCGEYEQGKISTMANMYAFKYRENKQAETKDKEYYDYVMGISMVAEPSAPYGASRNDIEPDGPHPYHGPDEDLVRAVAEKDTVKTIEDLKGEIKTKDAARKSGELEKGRPAK